ncbi:MAG: hypothetical protein EA378_11160 [Phycisphaerales bacterium]|nr:MAG: hypothetical protein EA378_11160 [Phycisphaerales bacterium]
MATSSTPPRAAPIQGGLTDSGAEADPGEGLLSERWTRFVKRGVVAGLGVSLMVHLVLMLAAALIVFQRVDGSLGGPPGLDEVDFAVMTDAELRELGVTSLPSTTPPVPDLVERETVEVELLSLAPEALSGLSPELGELAMDSGAGDIAGGLGAAGGMAGDAGTASFFGVEAVGRRFAFIVDRSGSMNIAGRWPTLQEKLLEAINGLSPNAQFFVVLFSSDAMAMSGRTTWTDASQAGKTWGRREIGNLPIPSGGTVPSPGFEMVLRVRPRPDAIYFMTDGEFAESQAHEIIRMVAELGIPVHCITFASDEGRVQMEMIARATGGSYTHVPGRVP